MTSQTAERRVEAARAELAAPWEESEERVVDVGAFPIAVRKRGLRYYLEDRGEAVARARALGATSDWLPIAEQVVAAEGFNVNRRGMVFVPVVEGRDLAALVVRLGESVEAVHAALVETV
ncbi:MAG: hypothetical protein ACRDQT_09795 [Gaiellaceae bacterium]